MLVALLAVVVAVCGMWQRETARRHTVPDALPCLSPRWPPAGFETVTAVALIPPAARFDDPWELAAYTALVVAAVPLALIDVADLRLPDDLTIPAYAVVTALLTVAGRADHRYDDLLRAGLGAVALAAFYLLLFLIRPAALGLGDVKLALPLGAALGWAGWEALLAGVVVTHACAALYGLALLASRRADRATELPFGPFMILGALAAIHAW
ncbi:A24 family peptidase [Spongiactinospora sp. TRM90649]|uniref:prepilin peptidase n=1 Tax=Spongiactinospora sp. TRM90649 TaxID=3031114 RepID=UPI0023F801BD|nr:A24 family peptidase [Spongiactinospora sp. TRM90649]MDF5752382.1 A24 family peptidase [Spongiactinospora sp. TRM90649]